MFTVKLGFNKHKICCQVSAKHVLGICTPKIAHKKLVPIYLKKTQKTIPYLSKQVGLFRLPF